MKKINNLDKINNLLKRKLVSFSFRYKFNNIFICESKYNANYLSNFSGGVETLIDVGVAQGTPELYAAFSNKKMLLIDPQPVPQTNLEEYKAKGYDMDTKQICLGSNKETGRLNLQGRGSTLLKRTELTSRGDSKQVEVEVDTLDNVIEQNSYTGPFALKIDTEGYEIEVLKGAKNTLSQSSLVMIEASIKKRFLNSYKFSELVNFMAQQDFELFDFLNYEPMRSPRYLDCLFLPSDSDLFERVDI